MPPTTQPTAVPPPTTKAVPPTKIHVNAGSGGAADPANRGGALDTMTVVLLIGGALLALGGGIALAPPHVA